MKKVIFLLLLMPLLIIDVSADRIYTKIAGNKEAKAGDTVVYTVIVDKGNFTPDHTTTPSTPNQTPAEDNQYHNPELSDEENKDLNDAFDDVSFDWSSMFENTDTLNNATTDSYTKGM